MAYFDNAATTYPKPECVYQYMDKFYRECGGNAGRGNYEQAKSAGELIANTRSMIQDLLHCPTKQVVFEPTATIALNLIIQGNIERGAHNIYVSPFEHNAVTRVLHHFEKQEKIVVRQLTVGENLRYDMERIRYQFEEEKPDFVIVSHASNSFGVVALLEDIFALAKKYGARTLADMSQTAGLIDTNVGLETFDYAVFAGHKTLYGPTGISGFVMNPEADFPAVLFGGTGFESANQDMPESLPQKYEAGTLNIAGVAGLYAAIKWINETGLGIIWEKEQEHRAKLMEILSGYDFIHVVGADKDVPYVGIVSCLIDGISSDSAGNIFDEQGISVRTGLECAPLAHQFMNTYPAGTIRFSVSYFTSDKDFKELNPHNNLSTDLDQFCTSFSNGYLIPLYLLIQTGRKKSQMQLRFKDIMTRISEYIKSEMYDYFTSLPSDAEQRAFVKKVMHDDPDECTELLDKVTYVDEFETVLDNRKDIWVDSMKIYLDSCVKTVYLSQIRVSASQRGRAIDIYENLNMGGVSLNTFDLIMARVAKVDKKNFLQRIKESIESTKTYPNSVLESSIKTILSSALTNKTYNATLKTNCINKGELNPRYIDAFLDVLCLYCNNPSFDPDKYKVDFIKKDKILNLVPEEINDNCEKVINALDRALFFFQTRCGIRTIGEINYNLMLVLVGTLFMEDSYFYNYEVHRLLEAWYWSVVFSGEYDKDQNSHMISNLQNIVRCVSGTNRDLTWLNSISANVLKMTNFSDKDLLLMNKVNEDRYPKPVLRNFMCQYLLSGTYMDMFDETKKISVFCEDADTLEAHHIIPLGSAKKVGEITADIRKNPRHICNSPLNFVYITKAANKDISDDALDAYEKKIQPAAKAALFISSYTPASHDTEIKVRGLLESRYSMMQGTISGEINDLLTNWM